MVATVVVQEITGTSGSKVYTTITNRVRLFTKDQATNQSTPQTDYPVPISGTLKRSFWKAVCLDLTGSGFTINNVRHYSDGAIGWAFGTNGKLKRGNRDAGDKGVPDASYEQATGTDGDSGNDLEASHTYFSGQTVKSTNINSDVVGAPATIDSGNHTVAEKTKHVVLQVEVDTDATQGTQTAETLTWKYDEQ